MNSPYNKKTANSAALDDILPGLPSFVEKLANAAKSTSLPYFRSTLEIETKSDQSPVTIADKKTESVMRELIAKYYPTHGVMGEEEGFQETNSRAIWVIDPIDGTKSFISGMPTFGTLIAFLYDDRPLIGVIDMPALNERWVGISGEKTLKDGKECRTSLCKTLAEAILYSTSTDFFDAKELNVFNKISSQASMRRFGGDCYSYGLLASGHVDVVMESSLQPYDYLSLIPVIEAAGGVITDWKGEALTIHSSGQVLACATLELHQEIIRKIASSKHL